MMFDDDEFDGTASHFFPSLPNEKTESVIPIAQFLAKKMRTLNTSFLTSTDSDERLEIVQAMTLCSGSLMLLSLAFFTESQELIEAAKQTYRELKN